MPSYLKTFKTSALVAAFTMAFLLSPLAEAGKKEGREGGHGHHGKHFYGNLKKIKEQLNLTDEQKTKLKDMKATHGKEVMKKKQEAMEQAHKDLKEALKSDASDETIREKFAALQKVQEDFAKTRFEHILLIRSVLTPEQRTKFKTLIGKE